MNMKKLSKNIAKGSVKFVHLYAGETSPGNGCTNQWTCTGGGNNCTNKNTCR